MTQVLSNTLAFIVALGVIVFVHELGHYAVAKAFGVRVLTFSLGFGRRIWGFHHAGTDYRISWIPLGGYVNFAGQDPGERSEDPSEFLNRPRWQRILVLLAGPLANVALAILLVAIVFSTGFAAWDPNEDLAIVGKVESQSAGAAAGLRPADRIVAIGDDTIETWGDFMLSVLTAPDRALQVELLRDGESVRTVLTPKRLPRDEIGEAGVWPVVRIGEVLAGSPAEGAGLREGDGILSVDGLAVGNFLELSEAVAGRAGDLLGLDVLRPPDQRLRIEVVPRLEGDRGLIGVGQGVRDLGPVEALVESTRFNANLTMNILTLVRKLFEREISLKASLGGPIQIAAVSGEAARRGVRELLLFMAFVSINLFIFNLFPIPILDGGQIVVLLIETTLRRDLSRGVKERITQVGLVMIVMLMAMALYFDLSKSLPAVFSPEPESSSQEPIGDQAVPGRTPTE